MQTLLDEEQFDTTDAGPSIGHVIEKARSDCKSRGRILVEILLNDEPIGEEAMSLPMGMSGSGGGDDEDCLSLISADPFDLVIETTGQASNAITEVINLQSETAELIQSGNLTDALPKLMEVINTWQQIQQCIEDGAALVGISVEDLQDGEDGDCNSITALRDQLMEIREAIRNQDLVALSDCLGYEMEPVAEQWRGLLEDFMQQVEMKRSADD